MSSGFKIYSKDGITVRYEGKGLTYHGSYLAPSYVEFKEIVSDTVINWQVGDYVYYDRTGYTYKLYQLPQAVQNSEKTGVCGERVVYSSVCLYAPTKDLEYALYLDLVEADNNIHFSTQENIATYEDVQGVARRIQACLDYFYPDSWDVQIISGLSTKYPEVLEARDFQMTAGDTILNALDNIYSVWDTIGWTYSLNRSTGKNVLTIGGANVQTEGNTIDGGKIGKGKGLTKLKFSIANNSDLCTRLYAFGSSRNLPARYYNSLNIKDAESVDIQNLMIPLDKWGKTGGLPDASKAYLDASEATQNFLGVRPKVLYFDDEEYGDFYPSIEGLTIGDVRRAKAASGDTSYSPSTTAYPDENARIDEIASVNSIPDDGVIDSSSVLDERTSDCSGQFSSMGTNVTLGSSSSSPISTISLNVGHYPTVLLSSSSSLATVTAKDGDTVAGTLTVRWGDNSKEFDLKVAHTSGATTFGLSVPSNASLSPDDLYEYKSGGGTVTFRFYVTATVKSSTASTKSLSANGHTITAKSKTGNYPYIDIYLKQIGFNIEAQRSTKSGALGVLEMKSGMCAGRSFKIYSCTYQAAIDSWLVRIKRVTDNSVGMVYPNTTYKIAYGDRFVLTGILMPDIYVSAQEQRLYARATEVLKELSRPIVVIEPSIDSIDIQNKIDDHTIPYAPLFLEGRHFDFESSVRDVIFGEWDYLNIIDSVTIKENEDSIPTFAITLREKKHRSFKSISESSYSESDTQDTDESTSSESSSESGGGTGGGGGVSSVNVVVNGASHKSDSDGVVNLPNYKFGSETLQEIAIELNGATKTVSMASHVHSTYLTDAPVDGKPYARKNGYWQEVEVDISGKADKTYVDTELAKKANRGTTIAEYGITNAYTKNQVDALVGGKADKTYVDTELGKKADKASTIAGYGITDAYTKNEVDEQIGLNNFFETVVVGDKTYLRLKSSTFNGTALSGLFTQDGQSLAAGGVGEGSGTAPRTVNSDSAIDYYELIGSAEDTLTEIVVEDAGDDFELAVPTTHRDGYVHRLVIRNQREDSEDIEFVLPTCLKNTSSTTIRYGEALMAEYYWMPSGTLVMNFTILS